MSSLLAWLDQRRMPELVTLFDELESRDELGIGAIRDAFSDRFSPGCMTAAWDERVASSATSA